MKNSYTHKEVYDYLRTYYIADSWSEVHHYFYSEIKDEYILLPRARNVFTVHEILKLFQTSEAIELPVPEEIIRFKKFNSKPHTVV